ncbi:MAG: SCO family protein [Verrucomicrobia bacterium]|nr:SCO family protein [Verrucomicrobiota bacterium]
MVVAMPSRNLLARIGLLLLPVLTVLLGGCVHRTPLLPSAATKGIRAYEVQGVVQELALDRRTAVIWHEAIPDYMPRMMMEFTVVDPRELDGIAPGDGVSFRLVVGEESHWIESIRRRQGSGPSSPAIRSIANLEMPATLKPGDPMPDKTLLGEHGQPVRFSDFHGQALAFTFIFSRCPLPDYCPRMSRHFEDARALLENEPTAPTNWHFLSISFDPEFDKPAVLTRYARSYRGDHTNRWLFAAAPTNVLPELSRNLDLLVNRAGGSFSHNLRTVVLDPLGRIHHQFVGNQWTPKELADSMIEAARLQQR